MRVIVTGGAGFIGSALVRHLVLEKGYEVLNVDALTYAGNLASLRLVEGKPNYRFLQADICDRADDGAGRRRFPARPDHASRGRKPRRSLHHRRRRLHPNQRDRHFHAARDGAGILVAPAGRQKDAFRFLHVSTDEVYGSLGDEGLFREDTPYDPSSPYSASKASSDHLAKAWQRTYGLPVVVSNCSNNYGPYHFPEKLIPLTILNALAGERLPVYGKGENVRDWLYVEDHARALDLIVERGRLGRNLQCRRPQRAPEHRGRAVGSAMCSTLRAGQSAAQELIEFVTDRPGHDARYAIDASKLETELGWRAQENFDTGIEKTVRWYLDNEWWWQPLRDRYAGQRLGLIKQRERLRFSFDANCRNRRTRRSGPPFAG